MFMFLLYVFFYFVNVSLLYFPFYLFFFNDTATTEIYTLSLHDALPISDPGVGDAVVAEPQPGDARQVRRSEEHTSELQSLAYLVCRLLLEKKKNNLIRQLVLKIKTNNKLTIKKINV